MKTINLSFISLAIALLLASCDQKPDAVWVSSTGQNRWEYKNIEDAPGEYNTVISIHEDSSFQVIDGWGAVFNELGWDALHIVSEEKRQEILKGFFDPDSGCKYNICRVPVGANDYSRDWYSLNDSAGDFEMKHFNIDRDKKNLIAYIKEAMQYRPDLKVWGSPWCPPAWMKVNNHYACRPDPGRNDLKPEGAGQEGVTQFIMEPEYLSAYADYLAKFVTAYQEEGVDLYAIHVQNEMNSCQNFPSCIWTSKDLATFIGDYLGPEFEKEDIDADIWYGTVERPSVEKVDTILQDEECKKYIKGVGFQWAGKKAIPGVNKKYPGMKLMQTESECGNGDNNWDAAEYTWSLMKHYISNGTNTYLYWNMVLNETGKSRWGWRQNSLISIDSETKDVTYNPEYYLYKHFSYFVEPGAVRIKTTGSHEDVLAFKNPGGEIVVVVVNTSDTPKNISINLGKDEITPTLAGNSFNTFVI